MTCECKFPWPLAVHKKKDGEQPKPSDPVQYHVHNFGCPEWKMYGK